ncbi:cytochrome P450 CYP749A22-like [Primulina tabacum]|uniref:cytochrome P450 CYP749A22-like n=1 Tax=Primulina tabacum TaxID=48773 RepID=UPI003F5ACFAE
MGILFSIPLFIIALILLRFIYKVIWKPFRIQSAMRRQGMTGPSYKLIHGSTKEAMFLKQQAAKGPMELSHDIFPRIHPNFYAWMKIYGKNFLTWNGPRPLMVISEPELAKEILSNKEGMYPKVKIDGVAEKLVGDGLVMTEGEKWSKLRKIANHAFYAENLKEMFPAMVASVETMIGNWKNYEGKELEVYHEFDLLSSEVIARTAFGSSYLEGRNIFAMLTKLGFLLFKNVDKVRVSDFIKGFKTKDDIESDKIEKSLRNSIVEIVRKREDKVFKGQEQNFGNDFLGSLLAAHHAADKKNRISVDNVIDECKVFFLAGHETTTSLLSWTFLFLAIHTDWQEKARNEVFQVFGQENPKSESLAKLKIVNMIINETLRLYSPVTNLTRRAKSNVRLGKYELPAHMEIIIPTLELHRSREIWGEDAHLFKPERFAEGVAKATRNNPMAFLPFGFGPRTCVGLNFASNEAKIALSMVLQQFKFTLSPSYVHSPIPLVTVRPQHGLPIVLQPLER